MRAEVERPLGGDGVTRRGGGVMRAGMLTGLAVALASAAIVLGACGNSRTPVPSSVTPLPPDGFRTLTYSAQGVALTAPRNWSVIPGRGPLVSTVTSGAAVMALWRFPRSAPPPAAGRTLRRIKRELVSEARARDPRLRLVGAALSVVGGLPSIELDAVERVGGQPRRVRSTHLFERHAELVLDQYAPPGVFQSVDAAVFAPVKRSLSPLRTGG